MTARTGRPAGRPPTSLSIRFFRQVDKNGPVPAHRPELGPCWVWTGVKDKDGYGRIRDGERKQQRTNRIGFLLANGRWPNPFALHHCDNPSCVRPDHLFEGDVQENHNDQARKGRTTKGIKNPACGVRGEANGRAKLSIENVRAIRVAVGSQAEIAVRFNVSQATVSNVRLLRSWKTV